jgi:hypothetical protein
MSLLQLACVAIFVSQGWLLIQEEIEVVPVLFSASDGSGVQSVVLAYLEMVVGVGLLIGAFSMLLVRIPFFAVLRWLLPFFIIASLLVVFSHGVEAGKESVFVGVGVALLPMMFFCALSFPRSLGKLGWASCSILAITLGMYGVWLMEGEFSLIDSKALNSGLGLICINLGVGLLVPVFRRVALYGILLVYGVRVYKGAQSVEFFGGIAEMVTLSSVGLLVILLLMLLQTWNPSRRLTLNMLEISSQTRRILSKATILHK